MLIENKYSHWYNSIIDNAKSRILSNEVYIEKHHIIPKSFGGNNSLGNLVQLTAREHFICHWLLTKCTTGINKAKMINALHIMQAKNKNHQRYSTPITSRVYSHIREEYSKTVSLLKKVKANGRKGIPHTEETKEKMRKPKPEGFGDIISIRRKGIPHTNERIKNISAGRKGQDAWNKGIVWSEETKEKMRKPKVKVTCPHCNLNGESNNMYRFHFESCKQKGVV